MENQSLRIHCPCWIGLFAILISAFFPGSPCAAFTPDSPEVKAMVERAYKSLAGARGERLGEAALFGICLVKNGNGAQHPVVASALKACLEACEKQVFLDSGESGMYGPAVACIFLCELDPTKYGAQINQFLKFLLSQQKPHGGWGYVGAEQGDTSQVQYVALALWTAHHAGFKISTDVLDRAMMYLIRTQNPDGGYGYQGNLAPGSDRVQQEQVRPPLTAAGVSSLFVLGDLLGYGFRSEQAGTGKSASDLPPALKLVSSKDDPKKPKGNRIQPLLVRRAMADGSRACNATPVGIQLDQWHHYFMYAFERFESFHELSEGQTEIKESRWYDDGVRYLQKTQLPDGGWTTSGPPHVDTAFGILFLIRSTKKAIAKVVQGEGTLEGGKGFRGNVANAKLRDGKIIGTVQKGPVDEMISVLEDPQNIDIESLAETPDFIELSTDPKKLASQVSRLRRLVSAAKFEVRLVAVNALGRTGDFENVPYLVYALTDPDFRVVIAAHNGLRLTSRKFDERLPEKIDAQARIDAVAKWKKWYKSVNPAAVFLD